MAGLDWIDEGLTDPHFFAAGRYYEAFATLRKEDPVHWTVGNAVKPYWSVTRHADCVAILRDPESFSSRLGGLMPLSAEEPTPDQIEKGGYGSIPTHTDPPRHLQIRRPFNKHFSQPSIAKLQPLVEDCVRKIVAEIAPLGQCDLVKDVTAILPCRIICQMMGVPEADQPEIQYQVAAFLGSEDPEFQVNGNAAQTQMQALRAVFDYMFELAMRRRSSPGDDFTSIVGTMEVDGEKMSERDVGWWCFSLVAAGLETTRDALAVGYLQLINNPAQAEELRTSPELDNLAIDEIVRYSNPALHKFRVAARDLEFQGRHIRKDDWVMAWIASANRDEEIFDRPDEFLISRKPNPHLGFGVGEHSCIGRHLARLEMAVMLRALLVNFPDMQLAGNCTWLVSSKHTTLKSLPVCFTPPSRIVA